MHEVNIDKFHSDIETEAQFRCQTFHEPNLANTLN